jgi:hypothetical protein
MIGEIAYMLSPGIEHTLFTTFSPKRQSRLERLSYLHQL